MIRPFFSFGRVYKIAMTLFTGGEMKENLPEARLLISAILTLVTAVTNVGCQTVIRAVVISRTGLDYQNDIVSISGK